MKKLRKFLVVSVMVLSVIAMSGLTFNTANAAAQAGDLIKMDGLSSVYYLGSDGKRYVFPDENTYFSWYNDFSSVVTIPASELQSYPLGSNVTMRPGTKLVKITTDPKVYAVSPNGTLHWVQSEADAIALYGANWASKVVDVADAFFTNYTIGTPLTSGTYPAGTLLKNADNASIYYFDGSDYRLVATEAAFVANRFNFDNVVTTDMTLTASGASVTGMEDFSRPSGATTGVVAGSGVTVALNAMTPASTSVPSTVSRVPFTKVNFTAAQDGAVTLESVTVRRTGLTTIEKSVKVWAEYNGNAVSTKRTLTNDEAILTLSPRVVVNAGQTVTLDILAELDNVTGNMALGIASASAVSASGSSVSGSFPINGNIMSLTEYHVTKLELTKNGAGDYPVSVGEDEVELAKFDIELTDNQRDVELKSITLRNTGVEDLDSVVMNLHLESAGEVVSENASFDGRYAHFNLKDGGMTILEDDGTHTFVVKGDIIDRDNSAPESLVFGLQRAEHVVAYEKATGFGVTYEHGNNVAISTVEIKSGVVTVSKKSTSPSDDSVVAGTSNVVALLANIKTDEAIYAEGLKVNYDGDVSSFQNIRVYLNNVLLDSFDLEVDSTQDGDFIENEIDSAINLNKGDNEVKVTVNVKSNATPTDAFKVKLVGTDGDLLVLPEYTSNGLFVSDDGISGTAEGALLTVEGGELSVTRNDGYSDKRVLIQGNTDVTLGKFAVKASNDKLRVTSVNLGANDGKDTATAHASIYDMKLFVDGNQVGTTRNFGSGGATFFSLNYEIAKNTTKVFELKGSFDSSAAAGDETYFKTTATFYAQDSTGSSVTEKDDDTAEFLVKESGELAVSVAPSTPNSTILIASSGNEQTLAEFRLTTQFDSANVTEINMVNASHVDGAAARVSAFNLYKGTTLLDSVVASDQNVTFYISNNQLLIPANSNQVITVKAQFNNIEFSNDSGKEYEMKLIGMEAKGSNGALIADLGVGDLTPVTANVMELRKTKPTFALVNGYNPAGSDLEQEMLRFSITADNNEDLQVTKLAVTLGGTTTGIAEATTGGAGDMKLYEVGDNTAIGSHATGAFTGLEVEIAAGSTKTFYVTADTSAVSTDERFGVSLRNDTADNILWKEYFVAGYGSAVDGELLVSFPLSGGVMTY